MRMPSGRRVVAQTPCRIFSSVNCYFNVWICVLAQDMYNSEGLCGNYNGIPADDRVPRDLRNPYPNYLDPILYSASFMYVLTVVNASLIVVVMFINFITIIILL